MTALGLVLVVAGMLAVGVEAHRPAHGMLGLPGVVALAAGAGLAVGGGAGVAAGIVVGVALGAIALGLVALTLTKGVAVRRRRIRSGPEAMIGRLATVSQWQERSGQVLVDGGLWRARLDELADREEPPPRAGEPVVVEYVTGLTLTVRRAEEWEVQGRC